MQLLISLSAWHISQCCWCIDITAFSLFSSLYVSFVQRQHWQGDCTVHCCGTVAALSLVKSRSMVFSPSGYSGIEQLTRKGNLPLVIIVSSHRHIGAPIAHAWQRVAMFSMSFLVPLFLSPLHRQLCLLIERLSHLRYREAWFLVVLECTRWLERRKVTYYRMRQGEERGERRMVGWIFFLQIQLRRHLLLSLGEAVGQDTHLLLLFIAAWRT